MESDFPLHAWIALESGRFFQVFNSDPEVFIMMKCPEMYKTFFVSASTGEKQDKYQKGQFCRRFYDHIIIISNSLQHLSKRPEEGRIFAAAIDISRGDIDFHARDIRCS